MTESGPQTATSPINEARFWIAHDTLAARLRERLGPTCRLNYCAYPETDDGLPIDNLEESAVKGRCVLVGPQSPESTLLSRWVSAELIDPTWWDVVTQAHQLLLDGNESTRIHLEGIQWIDPSEDPEALKRIELQLVA